MQPAPRVSRALYDFVNANAERLDAAIVDGRDYAYSYAALQALERDCLLKIDGKVMRRRRRLLARPR